MGLSLIHICYPFNITSSTAYDQKFIKGRNIFENISQLVDEMFNSYIRRIGFVAVSYTHLDVYKRQDS